MVEGWGGGSDHGGGDGEEGVIMAEGMGRRQ